MKLKVLSAEELDGQLSVLVEYGHSTHVVNLPAGSNRAAVRTAVRAAITEQENRERRKVLRSDLLGDL